MTNLYFQFALRTNFIIFLISRIPLIGLEIKMKIQTEKNFVIYINDLPDKLESDCYMFADDTKIFRQIASTY